MPSTPALPPRSRPGSPRARSPGPAPAASCSSTGRATASTCLLDFFVAAPGSACAGRRRRRCRPSTSPFGSGDTTQPFLGSARPPAPCPAWWPASEAHRRVRPRALARSARAGDRARPRRRRAERRAGAPARASSIRSSATIEDGSHASTATQRLPPRDAATASSCTSSPGRSRSSAADGAAGFYRGELARAISAAVRERRRAHHRGGSRRLPGHRADGPCGSPFAATSSSRTRRRRQAAC